MTHHEPHDEVTGDRMNWLRAGVLGANDGIVSTASLVVGVAGATTDRSQILVAGLAGLFAGAMSMASGEYVSVSSQRDAERALLAQERRELRDTPEQELEELKKIYEDKGLDEQTAEEVARQLTEHDALAAHADAELHIDPDELTNPWGAAIASFVAFTIGALLPLAAIALTPTGLRVPVTVAAAVLTLALTGFISARLSGAGKRRAVVRNIAGGLIAMGVTYAIGSLVGQSIG
ncbi:VIT1/CCC1 transporter family protein [Lentzea flaviverrucosa]|uniref:Predicted Fe2+/Mn2+ transporter, VIT1/CCC1 family n=1 Tax=Lentzea flaviverrucosa TaxID=200379 RepID=A0A1H9JWA4_9PSEU|nr:VIT family protein [Lentzea flaviverrucosa]RDI26661.1 VIT1/CCC1 family predicted Fe2+/Mn2+ transporter [Lentzea flaviverrucosa]SEQ91291.1 Predicted Fe2+/Mn2+ transporter, VIT1/CCC1 family [Lentzea flaviverrucosa]